MLQTQLKEVTSDLNTSMLVKDQYKEHNSTLQKREVQFWRKQFNQCLKIKINAKNSQIKSLQREIKKLSCNMLFEIYNNLVKEAKALRSRVRRYKTSCRDIRHRNCDELLKNMKDEFFKCRFKIHN